MTKDIILTVNGHIKGRELSFLQNTDKFIRLVVKVYSTLAGENKEFDAAYTKDGEPLGMSYGEYIPMYLDGIIKMNILSELQGIQLDGYFGDGPSGGKYLTAFTQLSDILVGICDMADDMEVLTAEDRHRMATDIRYAFGDLLFAFSHILFSPYTAYDIINTQQDFKYSSIHISFFENMGVTAFDYARFLFELGSKFVSIVPLFESDPDRWVKLTKDLSPQLVNLLGEFGTYITEFDIRLLEMHYFEANDAFIDMLAEREDNEYADFVGITNKNAWQDFTKLLTATQIQKLAEYVNSITYNDIYIAVDQGRLTDKYVDDIVSHKKCHEADDNTYLARLSSDLKIKEETDGTNFFTN